jgi:hypothetical protein
MKRIILLLVTMFALNLGNVSGQGKFIGKYIEEVASQLQSDNQYYNIERGNGIKFIIIEYKEYHFDCAFYQDDICSAQTYTSNSEEFYNDFIKWCKKAKNYKEGEERNTMLRNFTFTNKNGYSIFGYVQKSQTGPYFIQLRLVEDANDTVARRRARAEKRYGVNSSTVKNPLTKTITYFPLDETDNCPNYLYYNISLELPKYLGMSYNSVKKKLMEEEINLIDDIDEEGLKKLSINYKEIIRYYFYFNKNQICTNIRYDSESVSKTLLSDLKKKYNAKLISQKRVGDEDWSYEVMEWTINYKGKEISFRYSNSEGGLFTFELL